MEQNGNDFKALQILHKALLAGMVLFAIIAVVLAILKEVKIGISPSAERTLQVVSLLLSAAGVYAGFSIFNKRLAAMPLTDPVAERIKVYRSAAITRWALIEMSALFATLCFILTANYAFIALAIALMFIFAVVTPSKIVIVQQLQLNESEVAELEGASE